MPHKSGPGAIFGVVSEDGIAKPGQRVNLFDRDSNRILDSRIADSSGRYVFSGLDSTVDNSTVQSPYAIFALDNDSTYKNAVIHDRVIPVNAATGTTFSGNFYKYACIDRAPAYLFLPVNNGATGVSRVFTANYRSAFANIVIFAGAVVEDFTSTPGAPHIPSINLSAASIYIPRSVISSQNYSIAANYPSGKYTSMLAVFDITSDFQMLETIQKIGSPTGPSCGLLWHPASSTMCFNHSTYQLRFNMSAKLGTTVTSFEPTGNTIELVAHGFLDGEQVCFTNSTGTGLPTGLVSTSRYYVVNKTADNFQVSSTLAGAAINFSGTGSGTSYVTKHIVRAFLLSMFVSSTDSGAQACYVDDPSTLSNITGVTGTLTSAAIGADDADGNTSSCMLVIGQGYAKSATTTPGAYSNTVTSTKVGPVAMWFYPFTAADATNILNSLMKDETDVGFSTPPQFTGYVREVLADSPSNFIRPGIGYDDATYFRQSPFLKSALSASDDPDSTHYISEGGYVSGSHITVSGTSPTVSGSGLFFPGGAVSTAPYLSWPHAGGCGSRKYITVTFWMKLASTSTATVAGKYGIMGLPSFLTGYVSASGTTPAAGAPNCAIFLNSTGVSTIGAALFGITLNDSASTQVTNTYLMSGAVVPDTSWHHYAFVVDTYSASNVKFYKDGVLVTSSATSMKVVGTAETQGANETAWVPTGFQTSNTRKWVLGTAGDSTLSAYNLACSLGDAAIYASALTADRLLAHYNAAGSP